MPQTVGIQPGSVKRAVLFWPIVLELTNYKPQLLSGTLQIDDKDIHNEGSPRWTRWSSAADGLGPPPRAPSPRTAGGARPLRFSTHFLEDIKLFEEGIHIDAIA